MNWYTCELWIVDRDGKQHHCWTGDYLSVEDCRDDVITHHRHSTVDRPRIYQKNADGTKTFVEEIDMRTPEQIEYANTSI